MLRKKPGLLAVAVAVATLSACSAMILGESSTDSPPIGSDGRESAQLAADNALAEAVASALDASPMLRPAEVAVSARSGAVRLGGTVSSFDARDQAVKLAQAVPGVSSVSNQIRVMTSN
jgi:osmotically-inducible protein OsmY